MVQTHVVSLLLAVAPSLPIRTIPELLAYGKANPGKLSYASGGQGGSLHTAAELFKSMTSADILHIP